MRSCLHGQHSTHDTYQNQEKFPQLAAFKHFELRFLREKGDRERHIERSETLGKMYTSSSILQLEYAKSLLERDPQDAEQRLLHIVKKDEQNLAMRPTKMIH